MVNCQFTTAVSKRRIKIKINIRKWLVLTLQLDHITMSQRGDGDGEIVDRCYFCFFSFFVDDPEFCKQARVFKWSILEKWANACLFNAMSANAFHRLVMLCARVCVRVWVWKICRFDRQIFDFYVGGFNLPDFSWKQLDLFIDSFPSGPNLDAFQYLFAI